LLKEKKIEIKMVKGERSIGRAMTSKGKGYGGVDF